MIVKEIKDEDFINYKKPSMIVAFPSCTFKCEQECGQKLCQNSNLANSPDIEISPTAIVDRYLKNPITKAIVFAGLEPMDSWEDLVALVKEFRKHTVDDIVIYTGYRIDEICAKTYYLGNMFNNIVVKFGRFVPNNAPHFDSILGVNLASPNQYAVRIS